MELNVVVKMRILSKDVDADLEEIKKGLENIVTKFGELHNAEIKPIAFGLNSLEATILLNDSKGGMEEIEAQVKELKDVGTVEVLDVNRL